MLSVSDVEGENMLPAPPRPLVTMRLVKGRVSDTLDAGPVAEAPSVTSSDLYFL